MAARPEVHGRWRAWQILRPGLALILLWRTGLCFLSGAYRPLRPPLASWAVDAVDQVKPMDHPPGMDDWQVKAGDDHPQGPARRPLGRVNNGRDFLGGRWR
eukprot:g31602.t1